MIRRSAAARVIIGAAVGVFAVLAAAACGRATAGGDGPVRVVASTTMLGDVVNQVVSCAGGQTVTIMPVGVDPHDFTPSSAQVAEMVRADLVVTSGLGLEEGLAGAIASVNRDGGRVLEVAPRLDPIPFAGHDGPPSEPEATEPAEPAHGEESESEPDHAGADPHFWLDAGRMAKAARLVASELGALTGDAATYERCGETVAEALTDLDQQVREILAAVPPRRRVLITDHHAFGYFAQAYGFEVAGVVIPGGSTLASPSSAQIAELVHTIRDRQISVIFSNSALSQDLASQVAREAGAEVSIVPLYVGSLGGPGSEAETYQEMMLTNARRIADALAG